MNFKELRVKEIRTLKDKFTPNNESNQYKEFGSLMEEKLACIISGLYVVLSIHLFFGDEK